MFLLSSDAMSVNDEKQTWAFGWESWAGKQTWRHDNTSEQDWYQCKICSWWTPAKKGKCGSCGIKKALAINPPGSSAEAVVTHAPTVGQRTVDMVAPAAAAPPLDPKAQAIVDKASAEIVSLNNAINALPDSPEFAEDRHRFGLRIEQLKRSITKAKPPQQQLKSCAAALERAKARAERASQAQ